MILQDLEEKKLIHPPPWLSSNVHYLTVMGSMAYGTSQDNSDMDIYGFCIPMKSMIFTHLSGAIPGFGTQPPKFDQWQQHHIFDQSALGGKGREYDLQVFNITKLFQLCMENNPNCIDCLFTNRTCVLHITQVGNMVKDNRKLFLSKQCYVKFKGYAYSQLNKMNGQKREGKRKELFDKYGFDIKYAMHLIRLLDECEQILMHGDLDLMKNKEQLKAIRRGEMTEIDIRKWAAEKEHHLEKLFNESKLPDKPDEQTLKKLLLQCLEQHYGSLSNAISQPDWAVDGLREVDNLLNKYRGKMYQ